jgi:UDP-N-acetylmuramoylalanine--D-glutamate ligase
VLELSSFQLETTASLNATVAVVLNISPDHLDRYASVEDYTEAKRRIYHGDGVMVINADDPVVCAMAQTDRRVIRFTQGRPAEGEFGVIERQGRRWLAQGAQPLFAVDELRIAGTHNIANALAALALGSVVSLPREAMLESLRHFSGLPHRTQWVAECEGVRWYNDSKGTNVGATLASINGMPAPLILIAGGLGKGADFTALRPALRDKVKAVILLGRDAPRIRAVLQDTVPLHDAADMREAVHIAHRLAVAGDTVLLSPACASFDMYDSFEHRGDAFIAAVREVTG